MAGPPQTPEALKNAQALAHRVMLTEAWQLRCILLRRIELEVPGDAYRDSLQHIVDALDFAFAAEQIGAQLD